MEFHWLLGLGVVASLVVGAALTATSISITSLVLRELKQIRKVESRMIVSAAVVDDVLGLAVLGVIVSFISTSTINPLNVLVVILTSLALWLIITVFAAFVLPKIINLTSRGESEETVEAAATASCFGASALAAYLGLSPIVGAFAAGMGIASSKTIEKIRNYTKKISVIFLARVFRVGRCRF